MTTITVDCRFCSTESNLAPLDVLLRVYPRHHERDDYRFTCPGCHEENVKPAPEGVKKLLLSGSVRVETILIPDEADDPKRWGGRLCWDDVLDFSAEWDLVEEMERGVS